MLRMMQSASSVPNSLQTHHFWLIKMWQGYASAGYIKESRKPVTDQLFKVVKQLRAQHAVARGGSALQIISGARIPIIKVSEQSHSHFAAATKSIVVWSCWQLQFCCCQHIHAHLQTPTDPTAYPATCR